MKKHAFSFPMRTYERVIGLMYIPVHSYIVPRLMFWMFDLLGVWPSGAHDLIYYGFSAVFLLLVLNRYWRATIRDFTGAPFRALQAVVIGYVSYIAMEVVMDLLMSLFLDNLLNPNSAAVADSVTLNPQMMFVVTVLLAPIAEETMFRGALFGTLRKKNRVAAYIVSALLFGMYHIWDFALGGGGALTLVYAMQYIPASIALAWCYEHSGALVAPVVLHALINLIATVSIVWR